MKQIIPLICIISLLNCRTLPHKENLSTPDLLAQKVLESIKEKSIGSFLRLAITPAEFVETVELQKNEKSILKLSKREMLEWWLQDLVKIQKRFYSVIEEGEKNGIKWEHAVFEHAEYKIEKKKPVIFASYIDIVFSCNKKLFKIRLDDCVKLERGWLMVDKIIWEGRVQ